MKTICISGKARHGKDTAASFIQKRITAKGYKVLIVHYADILKYVCKTFFDWNGVKDEYGRSLLQHVGTDVMREYNPDFWTGFVGEILYAFKGTWDYVVIPDCRFPNEIRCMKDYGFDVYTIRIIRDDFNNKLSKEQQEHLSETALDDYNFDFVVHNSNMSEFYKKITNISNQIMSVKVGRRLTILVDLDDVLNNLLQAWVERLNEIHGTNVNSCDVTDWGIEKFFDGLSSEEVFAPLYDPEFWDTVKPLDGSVEGLRKLISAGHNVYIVTSSNYNTIKYKIDRFLHKYFPFVDSAHIITAKNKQMIRGDIMIDNAVHNLVNGEYEKILVTKPYNRDYPAEINGMHRADSWADILSYVHDIAEVG